MSKEMVEEISAYIIKTWGLRAGSERVSRTV